MENEQKGTIESYCKDMNITISDFAKITGLSYSRVYTMRNDRDANWTVKNISSIYQGTQAKFGLGLQVDQYSNFYNLIK